MVFTVSRFHGFTVFTVSRFHGFTVSRISRFHGFHGFTISRFHGCHGFLGLAAFGAFKAIYYRFIHIIDRYIYIYIGFLSFTKNQEEPVAAVVRARL